MKRFLLAIVLTALAAGAAQARVRTTQPHLSTNAITVPVITISTDTTAVPTGIPDNAISLRGFHKRASDSKESFFVTNHLKQRISCIRVLLRYTTLDGQMLTERVVSIPVDLRPEQTQLVTIKSFDRQRAFYYHAGPKPRKTATPFQVAFRLEGYDIPVGK